MINVAFGGVRRKVNRKEVIAALHFYAVARVVDESEIARLDRLDELADRAPWFLAADVEHQSNVPFGEAETAGRASDRVSIIHRIDQRFPGVGFVANHQRDAAPGASS